MNDQHPFGIIASRPNVEYKEWTVEELLEVSEKFKEDERKGDDALLNALVDIVNRSPLKPHEWAARLKIEFTEFVQVCHRDRPISDDFRNKVFTYFHRIHQEQNPSCAPKT